jgi:translation initiation factor IF-1
MPSDKSRYSGIIESAQGNGFFNVLVTVDKEKKHVLCQLSGKMRTNNIKVVEGDNVDVELDPYDGKKGRIIYRRK